MIKEIIPKLRSVLAFQLIREGLEERACEVIDREDFLISIDELDTGLASA